MRPSPEESTILPVTPHVPLQYSPPVVQMDFPALNLGMFGQTDARKARKLPWALEHLRAQALASVPTS